MKFFLLIVKNLRRNLLRTTLTSLAIIVLVFMVTLIWTMLFRLGKITEDKSKDFKLIVTEKWQIPSQMPASHADFLDPDNKSKCILPKELHITGDDFMTWSFYGGFVDPKNRSWDTLVFMFVMDPLKICPMMEELGDLDPALVKKLVETRNGVLMGRKRLERINKRVGETFTVYSMNYKNIDLEFQIVGILPADRYDEMGICNEKYFNEALNNYPNNKEKNPDFAKKAKHPLDLKRLNLIWLRVRDKETFAKVADLIERGVPNASTGGRLQAFKDPEVKCETASSGVASFLDSFRDLFWFIEWILVPVILLTMVLILANAISISVRERRTEMAVLKVLGFSPSQVLILVLGEALLVGAASGLLAAAITYSGVNFGMGGIPFPILWMSKADFKIPVNAFAWGLGVGVLVGLLGSIIPAWSARNVKPSQVFAKVA
jgi:putative ABC transport system permease protein